MTFAAIKQKLENIDYSWTKPQSYLVLVPGLSLTIQKIQLAKTLPLIHTHHIPSVDPSRAHIARAVNGESRKLVNICNWHFIGSGAQIIASCIAINTIAASLFPLLATIAIVAFYEMIDTFIQAFQNKVILYKFDATGNVKGYKITAALTLGLDKLGL